MIEANDAASISDEEYASRVAALCGLDSLDGLSRERFLSILERMSSSYAAANHMANAIFAIKQNGIIHAYDDYRDSVKIAVAFLSNQSR